ncbi:L,D-transpeptidase family protein [Flavobacterium sharifuzzamanii]|uniref:L,D-transpeptidase family protein n=1 Tax=Flavobacterium sharifuzzamanii TaxID=2211133 RepID=UPI000DAF0612|nr:L,D-transpeptidase family protein [Flavobacterium sharifuzzamanii]KAF2079132.1 L,D-transpeptidase family protein [Flavobacterium sharifuzzamanii]
MKIWYTPIIAIVFFAVFSCNSKADKKEENSIKTVEKVPELKLTIDSMRIAKFYENYPKLDKFKNDVTSLYQKNKSTQLWQDNKGIVEFANTLFNQYKNLGQEGLKANYPYNEQLNSVFDNNANTKLSKEDTDLILSNLYYYYGEKVGGFDEKTVVSLEWLLPRKKLNYQVLSDSIFKKSTILDDKKKKMFSQYYKLRDALKQYREIEKNGGWKIIETDEDYKSLKVGDSSAVVAQIRERLFVTKDIEEDNKSAICDTTLIKAMKNYELRHGYTAKNTILLEHINDLNIPVSDRIKTIIVNMERCRWIDPELEKGQKYIEVNIPEFRLYIVEDGKIAFVSPVVVGRAMTKTVIFSGMMSNIVFSPYWNVPPSIIKSEIKPGMAKDKNYLQKKNLEWNNGAVRQLPGKNNSLGLVKFLFPNSSNIYLHDTPSKSLFERESRAFSHGCVRVAKPRELAIELLKVDPQWNPERIDKAMHAGKESWYTLKKKVPVYIGYFTAWVDRQGNLNFYKDIYGRDESMIKLLTEE